MKASEIMTPMRIDALDDNMSKVKKDTISGKKEDALVEDLFVLDFRMIQRNMLKVRSKMSLFFGAFLAVCHLSQAVSPDLNAHHVPAQKKDLLIASS
jgi:hypothetical protein